MKRISTLSRRQLQPLPTKNLKSYQSTLITLQSFLIGFCLPTAAGQMPRYVSRKHDLAIDHHRDGSLKQMNRDNYFTLVLHLRKDSLDAA